MFVEHLPYYYLFNSFYNIFNDLKNTNEFNILDLICPPTQYDSFIQPGKNFKSFLGIGVAVLFGKIIYKYSTIVMGTKIVLNRKELRHPCLGVLIFPHFGGGKGGEVLPIWAMRGGGAPGRTGARVSFFFHEKNYGSLCHSNLKNF